MSVRNRDNIFTMRKALWHCEPYSFGAKDAEEGGLGVPLLVTVESENQKQCKAHGFAPGVSSLGYWRIKSKVCRAGSQKRETMVYKQSCH